MANNFFASGFDDLFGELANLALPPPFTLPPLPSPAAGNRLNTNHLALQHPSFAPLGFPGFPNMCPLPLPSPSGFVPVPGASPGNLTQWQPRQAAQVGARSGTTPSFISGPTFSHGAPHPPTPMPSTAPASLSDALFQQPTTIGQFQPAPTQPQPPQRTVNNLSYLLSSSRPADHFHSSSRTFTPPAQQQQREPNSDDFYLDQFFRGFSSPSIPSASGTPQRPATVNHSSNASNPFSGTRFPRISPLPPSRAPRVAPPVGLRVPPPPSTSNTNEEEIDSDSADNMPASSRAVHASRRPSSARQQPPLPQASRVSGAASSSSATSAYAPQTANVRKNQSSQRTAGQAASRRASNVSASATGSATKRKHDEFELDNFDSDDLFGDHDPEVIDLVDKDVPDATAEVEEREEEKKKNWVKLSRFQCVICMDDVTDLTVTYCGHLFCSECLHSALQITPHKRICPICRQKIENKNAIGKFGPKAKGYYPLEIKLVTKKSLEKRATTAASRNNFGDH
ncbi:hypothetical protein QBC40DRAFT_97782 [Triangularia verruculosa]|uniref:RING-type domain-containing protein n=1 Tax=Triangularia verruculosa TaxID=2587418 RepID=A0AAN6XPX8_9PEZI|nr:hypothetical protein QBC40DRAFT_97782 [Triangularia verruculosa]